MPPSSIPCRSVRTHLRAALLALVSAGLNLSPAAHALDLELPEIGVPSDTDLPREQQRSIGAKIYKELQKQDLLLKDPLLQAYLSHLGHTLVSHAGETNERFTFFVLKDTVVNAFATPGGYVGVNAGLILAMQSEAQLASVVAHEISHVTQHHLARAFGASKSASLPLAAGLLAALLVGGSNAQATQAILYGTIGANAQGQINFTRSNEQEADRIGIGLLARSGYNPEAMGQTFAQMSKLARFQGASAPEFLRSHPLYSSRISDALERADQYPRQRRYQDSTDFYLMRARLRVLTAANPADLAQQFRASLNTGKTLNTLAARYGLALSLMRDNKFNEATRILEKLIKQDDERIPYYLALSEAQSQTSGHALALQTLDHALEIYPQNLTLSLAVIDQLIANHEARRAEQALRPLLSIHRDKPQLYDRMSRIAAARKRPAEAYLARAEAFYLRGHLGTALEQLEQARRLPLRNENVALRVASRLKQIKKELKDDLGHKPGKKDSGEGKGP